MQPGNLHHAEDRAHWRPGFGLRNRIDHGSHSYEARSTTNRVHWGHWPRSQAFWAGRNQVAEPEYPENHARSPGPGTRPCSHGRMISDCAVKAAESTRRGGRVVDGSGLENRRGESLRGFESRPLRFNRRSKTTEIAPKARPQRFFPLAAHLVRAQEMSAGVPLSGVFPPTPPRRSLGKNHAQASGASHY
jgi:hypothetical protein